MANYQLLKADIDKKVYQNGEQEITGANLNAVLNAMVTTLGAEYQFAGIATPSTNPRTPDQRVVWIAADSGIYSNFDGTNNQFGNICIFINPAGQWQGIKINVSNSQRTGDTENSAAYALRRLITNGMYVDKLGANNIDGYLASSGNIGQLSGSKTSDFVPVIANAQYQIYSHLLNAASIVFYDANKQVISSVSPNDGWNNRTITTPANCAYLRYCTLSATGIENQGVKYIGSDAHIDPVYNDLLERITGINKIVVPLETHVSDLETTVNGVYEPIEYTETSGEYINIYGNKASLISGRITTPILLTEGDVIKLKVYANENVGIISKTDASGSSYTVVLSGTVPTELKDIIYTVQESGYYAISFIYSSRTTIEKQITTGLQYDILELRNGQTQNTEDIQELKKTVGIENLTPIEYTVTSGQYIYFNGSLTTLSSGRISNPVAVSKGDIVRFIGAANSAVAMISKTNASGSSYTPVVIGTGETSGMLTQTAEYLVTEDGYVAFCSINGEAGTAYKVVYGGILGRLIYVEESIDDFEPRISRLEANEASTINILAAFDNIVCVGDSLTYSQVYTGTSASRQAKRTYPQVLAKLCGNEQTTLARAGATALECWNEFSSQVIAKTNPLAIIYLGTNYGVTDTLDTDVVGDNPDNWANNNVGCYCRFVQKFQSLGYKVLLLRIWVTSGTGDSDLTHTNSAINHIATRFGCAVMDVPKTAALEYHYYPDLSGYNGVHYNDLGYSWFATKLIEKTGLLPVDQMKLIIPNS